MDTASLESRGGGGALLAGLKITGDVLIRCEGFLLYLILQPLTRQSI
jgi:hypothetical protein